MLQLGVELDLLEVDGAGEEHVHELTVDGAGAELLDLDVPGLKRFNNHQTTLQY